MVDSGLVSPPESAALDEAILEAHIEGKVPNTLHFYRRAAPTISVGYFQKISQTIDQEECERRGVAIIRRKSGGRSIYTDPGQLIYGLVLHEGDLPGQRAESFKVICTAIAEAISSFGVEAVYRPMNDVEVNGQKISGNAQLRRKGSVLQHGTVVVDTDLAQMDAVLRITGSERDSVTRPSDRVTTLTKLLGTAPDMEIVKGSVVFQLGAAFNIQFSISSLIQYEQAIAEKLVSDYYSRKEWNFKF